MCGKVGEPLILAQRTGRFELLAQSFLSELPAWTLDDLGHLSPAEAPAISSARFLHVARREARGLSALALALAIEFRSGDLTGKRWQRLAGDPVPLCPAVACGSGTPPKACFSDANLTA